MSKEFNNEKGITRKNYDRVDLVKERGITKLNKKISDRVDDRGKMHKVRSGDNSPKHQEDLDISKNPHLIVD